MQVQLFHYNSAPPRQAPRGISLNSLLSHIRDHDNQENPLLINPEKEDPIPHFSFSVNGHVKWLTEKAENTWNVCRGLLFLAFLRRPSELCEVR